MMLGHGKVKQEMSSSEFEYFERLSIADRCHETREPIARRMHSHGEGLTKRSGPRSLTSSSIQPTSDGESYDRTRDRSQIPMAEKGLGEWNTNQVSMSNKE